MSAKSVRFKENEESPIGHEVPTACIQHVTESRSEDETSTRTITSQTISESTNSNTLHTKKRKKKKTELQKLKHEKKKILKELKQTKKSIKEDSANKESENYSPFENRRRLARTTSEMQTKLEQIKDQISVKKEIKKEKTKKSMHTKIKKKSIKADKQHSRIIKMTGRLERIKLGEEALRMEIAQEISELGLEEKKEESAEEDRKMKAVLEARRRFKGLTRKPSETNNNDSMGDCDSGQNRSGQTSGNRISSRLSSVAEETNTEETTWAKRTTNALSRLGSSPSFIPGIGENGYEWVRMPCVDPGMSERRYSSAGPLSKSMPNRPRRFSLFDSLPESSVDQMPKRSHSDLTARSSQRQESEEESFPELARMETRSVQSVNDFLPRDVTENLTSSWDDRPFTGRSTASIDEKKRRAENLAKKYQFTRELRNTIHEHMISRSYSYSYNIIIPPYKHKKEKSQKSKVSFNRAVLEDKIKVTEFSKKFGSSKPKVVT
ncbi:uncharacterized protein LOC116618308 [Nematostella vectensis]|uniref:uncharacterized protein LOC116618308 n=1 Tax=Nematostella vectensis TaxID=45351 RepID=UPI00207783EB|nr:uncharacterized protein LOC116618308 [Nematostella vectensis]